MVFTLPDFLGFNRCIKYLATHSHKPFLYAYISYEGSNVIRVTQSGHKFEYYNTQFFCNAINMRSIPGFWTYYYGFMGLFISFLVFLSSKNSMYNLLWPQTLSMGKSGTCINISRKLRWLGDRWRYYHSTLCPQNYIRSMTQVLFILFNTKELHLVFKVLLFVLNWGQRLEKKSSIEDSIIQ